MTHRTTMFALMCVSLVLLGAVLLAYGLTARRGGDFDPPWDPDPGDPLPPRLEPEVIHRMQDVPS